MENPFNKIRTSSSFKPLEAIIDMVNNKKLIYDTTSSFNPTIIDCILADVPLPSIYIDTTPYELNDNPCEVIWGSHIIDSLIKFINDECHVLLSDNKMSFFSELPKKLQRKIESYGISVIDISSAGTYNERDFNTALCHIYNIFHE